jgi:tetratricopeptide (TPR) repeat protein
MTRQPAFLCQAFSKVIFLFAITVSCDTLAYAQGGAGGANNPNNSGRSGGAAHSIRGKIFLPSGATPDQRIRVVLEMSAGGIVSEAFSDSVGNFEFRALPNGTYKIVVPSDGRLYEMSQETVELYGNSARTFSAQIYLKEKGGDLVVVNRDKILSVADLQQVPKSAKKNYDNGLKRARENQPEAAVALFREAVRVFPEYLAAINKLGEQLRVLNNPAEAEESFKKAIALNSKYALPQINLGMLLVDQKRYDEAIPALENGNALDDTFPMSHLKLGEALMSKTPPDYDRAEKEMTRALELGKRDFIQVRKHLFNLNLRQQKLDKAAEQLEAYLKDAPEAPDAEQVRQTLERVKKMIAQKKG